MAKSTKTSAKAMTKEQALSSLKAYRESGVQGASELIASVNVAQVQSCEAKKVSVNIKGVKTEKSAYNLRLRVHDGVTWTRITLTEWDTAYEEGQWGLVKNLATKVIVRKDGSSMTFWGGQFTTEASEADLIAQAAETTEPDEEVAPFQE